MCVCHICDNRACVNPAHLFIGTIADNNLDAKNKGRHKYVAHKGTANGRAKLSENDVIAIYESLGTCKKVGNIFGVSHTTVWNIRNGRKWKEVTGHVE